MSASIIICANSKEQTEKRNTYKKYAKANGTFMRVERDTVVLKGGNSVTFVVNEAPEIDDEHLPKEAFDETARKAARDMME